MTITNHFDLPAPIVAAVENDPYDKGECDISCTELITPPRIIALRRKHENEITEDASDRLWSLMGQLGHAILERAGTENIVEKRLFATIAGWKIGGQVDLIMTDAAEGVINDYKFTSIWTAKDGLKPEWEQQVNILRWLAWKNNINITSAGIVAIYRDWSKSKARRERDYPQSQVEVFNVPLWDIERTESFIAQRIALHKAAREHLPECSAAERWAVPTMWAVKKPNNKRATRTFTVEQDAIDFAANTGLVVEMRIGRSLRCESYCDVAPFCSFWHSIMTI